MAAINLILIITQALKHLGTFIIGVTAMPRLLNN